MIIKTLSEKYSLNTKLFFCLLELTFLIKKIPAVLQKLPSNKLQRGKTLSLIFAQFVHC